MKVRFFILGAENNGASERLQTELKYLFSEHLTDDGGVLAFAEIKDASTSIAKAVEDTHVLIFIADASNFGMTKLMLSKAFGFELKRDDKLLKKAYDTLEMAYDADDRDFAVTHSYVPVNSRTFVMDDGLYAGFSVANGNQTVIVLPFDKERTSILFSTQVVSYLNATYHVNIDLNNLRRLNTEILRESLEGKDCTIAVSGTNTASFFKEYVHSDESLKDTVRFSEIAEKRGTMQPVDYVVNLSVTAAELLSCPYGVALSNALYTGDTPECEKIVYLAVTNDRETYVREVHSFPGEDITSFLSRCCGFLCRFVSEVLGNDDEYVSDKVKRVNAAKKRYKIAIATVAVLIAGIVAFTLTYFNKHDYSFRTWADNFIEWVFPAGNPFEGMFDRFVPGEDENITADSTQDNSTMTQTEKAASTEEGLSASETTQQSED